MILGAIADDLTGATDLALTLARSGLRTVQVVGLPPADFDYAAADAVVVALKSRTIPAPEAVALSVAAQAALTGGGARQILFKYCSTFDSTDAGNIGPVAAALMAALNAPVTVACPAFPANGRTVFQGHLFVGRQLLSDSPMRDHPLTPMRNANLVQVLQAQTAHPVDLVPFAVIDQGAAAIRAALTAGMLVLDAISEAHLIQIGAAIADLALITGGSGIALGLAEAYRARGWLAGGREADWSGFEAPSVMLAGSCSSATRAQIAAAQRAGVPSLRIDPLALAEGRLTLAEALAFVQAQTRTPLIYSSADPADVAAAQARLGREAAGALVEQYLAEVACALRDRGWRRFVVAGGETSGAVVQALGVQALRIGPDIDPGVPWTRSVAADPLLLALKSGNFGAEDFFTKAWSKLA